MGRSALITRLVLKEGVSELEKETRRRNQRSERVRIALKVLLTLKMGKRWGPRKEVDLTSWTGQGNGLFPRASKGNTALLTLRF